jgi:formate dehydrogenase iron-sulfur subunit
MATTQKGMFVDTSICTGCKACQVACKQWNQLPMEDEAAVHFGNAFTGDSYDNTGHLSATNWRHVKFIEQFSDDRTTQARWLMMSDSCKHCVQAGCLEVCPTGALFRTDYGAVDIHRDVCIGCRYCVGACPFGVISYNDHYDPGQGGPHMLKGTVNKCVLCSDRVDQGLGTACATACPTSSLTFGNVDDLKRLAAARVRALHARGQTDAYVYGWDLKEEGLDRPASGAQDVKVVGGLNVFYLLLDKPSVYGLPDTDPGLPQRNFAPAAGATLVTAAVLGVAGIAAFRKRRMDAADAAD